VSRAPSHRGLGARLPARWRSVYAEDCKSLPAGSIPARASTFSRTCTPSWIGRDAARLRSAGRVEREAGGELRDLVADPGLGFGVALPAMPSQALDELRGPAADLGELGLAEAARRPGGSAEADTRRDERAGHVERHAVLIAG